MDWTKTCSWCGNDYPKRTPGVCATSWCPHNPQRAEDQREENLLVDEVQELLNSVTKQQVSHDTAAEFVRVIRRIK